MTANKVHEHLDANGIAYQVSTHDRAVTAQRLAASEHQTGWNVAKPVMLKVGDQLAMAVLPAPLDVDLDRAGQVLGGNDVRLATEEEFTGTFDGCEAGAEPPFGNLWGVPVFMDEHLRERPEMICRDGSHTEAVTLATNDYVRLVQPEIVDLCRTT